MFFDKLEERRRCSDGLVGYGRCGSQRRSTTSPVLQSCTGNVSRIGGGVKNVFVIFVVTPWMGARETMQAEGKGCSAERVVEGASGHR